MVDGYGPVVAGVAFGGPLNAFLVGSLMNTRLQTAIPPPIIPTISYAALQPWLAMINYVSEARAPPR